MATSAWASGGLHPAKLHAGLLRVATGAGAGVHEQTPVLGIGTDGEGFEVSTARGRVRARGVVVATDGYTDRSDLWLRRRLVPVRSRIIASAPLSPDLMGELMPRRTMCDVLGDAQAPSSLPAFAGRDAGFVRRVMSPRDRVAAARRPPDVTSGAAGRRERPGLT